MGDYRIMNPSENPFPKDPDRHEIWEILMRRDFEAFVAADWSLTKTDFAPDLFVGYDAKKESDPDRWSIHYPALEPYRDEWLSQAREFQEVEFASESKLEFLFRAIDLNDIQINGGEALAHKKFHGSTQTTGGEEVTLQWQTLYMMRKIEGHWKIRGFLGYLPFPMPKQN